MRNPTYIIAEAGVNHNGNRDMAFQLIDAAVDARADAVKFQTFKAEYLVTKNAVKAYYQQQTTDANESQYAMLKRLELEDETHFELIKYCKEKGIEFLSTAFDSNSLNFLIKQLGFNKLKISSGDITNGPFLLEHALTGCDLIVSTGMATIKEVKEALSVIAFGLISDNSYIEPSRAAFNEAYNSSTGQQALHDKITLLHCTTEYPAPLEDINLNAMLTMQREFGLKTGYSDHSKGIIVPIAAATLGATIIEKHFTLDKALPGPDHMASLEPVELKSMVATIRNIELIMGDGLKEPMPSEIMNRDIARKSLIAACDIAQGDLFTKENLTIKRPGNGKSPMEYWDLLGQNTQKTYHEEDIIF